MKTLLILLFLISNLFAQGNFVKTSSPIKGEKELFKTDSYWYYFDKLPKLNKGVEIFKDDSIFALSINPKQWNMFFIGLEKININKVWNKNVKIHILDSGPPADTLLQITHPDLQRFKVGNNYTQMSYLADTCNCGRIDTIFDINSNRNWDDLGHSTHIAGIIGAADNNFGVTGIDQVSEITFTKILRDWGWGYWNWAIKAILNAEKDAIGSQMDIIVNCSFGGGYSRVLEELIDYLNIIREARGYGVILVASAGNSTNEFLIFPAMFSHFGLKKLTGYNNVISVGALIDKEVAPYSNFGKYVDIFAPGGKALSLINNIYQYDSLGIYSTSPDSLKGRLFYYKMFSPTAYNWDYTYMAGTSMASPHVVGAIARYIDIYGKGLNIKQILNDKSKVFNYTMRIKDYDTVYTSNHTGKYLYLPDLFSDYLSYRYEIENWFAPLHNDNFPKGYANYFDFIPKESTDRFYLEISKEASPFNLGKHTLFKEDMTKDYSSRSFKFRLELPNTGSSFIALLKFTEKDVTKLRIDWKCIADIGSTGGVITFISFKNGKITYTDLVKSGTEDWQRTYLEFNEKTINSEIMLYLQGERVGTDIYKEYLLDNLFYYKNERWIPLSLMGEGRTTSVESFSTPDYKLYQNYPNPFNPSTIIQYSLPKADNVKLVIYDILGKEVEILIQEYQAAGDYKVNFNVSHLASGIYFYKLQTSEFSQIRKMIVLK